MSQKNPISTRATSENGHKRSFHCSKDISRQWAVDDDEREAVGITDIGGHVLTDSIVIYLFGPICRTHEYSTNTMAAGIILGGNSGPRGNRLPYVACWKTVTRTSGEDANIRWTCNHS